jgi:hypothetical protein
MGDCDSNLSKLTFISLPKKALLSVHKAWRQERLIRRITTLLRITLLWSHGVTSSYRVARLRRRARPRLRTRSLVDRVEGWVMSDSRLVDGLRFGG